MSKNGGTSSRVMVRGLPKHLTEERFREHFGKLGPVTDAKIVKTKDGRSRMFGFIGYRNPEEARRAVEYFNGTFVDTSRVRVELAKPVGDPTLDRPWSRYSKGSSRYAALHPQEAAADLQAQRQRTKKRPRSEDDDNEELQRFLSAMDVKPATKKPHKATAAEKGDDSNGDGDERKEAATAHPATTEEVVWDDDDDDDGDEDDGSEKKEKPKAIVDTARVESKKPGGKGVFLRRTHVRFTTSDSETEEQTPQGPAECAPAFPVFACLSLSHEFTHTPSLSFPQQNNSAGAVVGVAVRKTTEPEPEDAIADGLGLSLSFSLASVCSRVRGQRGYLSFWLSFGMCDVAKSSHTRSFHHPSPSFSPFLFLPIPFLPFWAGAGLVAR